MFQSGAKKPCMLKKFVLGLFVAGAMISAFAFADPNPRPDPPDPARMAEMRQKHLDQLHQKLALKPEQEAAWQTFVEKTPPPPRPEREDLKNLKAPQRLERMLQHLRTQEAQMQEHLAALTEFYNQLTPEQQEIFDRQPPPPHPPIPPPPGPDAP